MQCIKKIKRKQFFFTESDSINFHKTEINFQIYDTIKQIYYFNLVLEPNISVQINQQKNSSISYEQNLELNKDWEIERNPKYILIKNIGTKNTLFKIQYHPINLCVYYHNRVVLKIDFINGFQSNVIMKTTFCFIKDLYGLAERASHSKLANHKTYRLFNTDEFLLALHTDQPLYGSVPFVIGHTKDHCIGLLWENTSDTRVKLTRTSDFLRKGQTSATWHSEIGDSKLVCFIEKSPIDVRKMFMNTTGKTVLPPLFALGYHQCRWNYNDQQDMLQVDESMDKAEIPYDTIWLDIEHTHGKRYMTWDTDKFNPQELVEYLEGKNRHLVVIIDPHLKVDDEYSVYREAKEKGFLIRDETGSIFVGKCWPGDSSWIDFINNEACTWWSDLISSYLKNLNRFSKSNNVWVWNDMNEPSVFESPGNQLKSNAKHVDDVEHKRVHNIYGQKMAQSSWEGILKATDNQLRPFLLSRSFYTGSQKYGTIWTGDSAAKWDHLQISVSMMVSLSLCGIDFCGSDVGGFYGDPDMELLTRWYQLGSLQPFFREHSHIESKRREPYLIEDPYRTAIKKAITMRYRLLAYWYLCFRLAELEKEPVVSPIWMHFSNSSYLDHDEMFLIGSEIVARPIVKPSCTSISVILPGADDIWFYYCDSSSSWKMYNSNKKIHIPILLESMPLFYHGGSCIFMKDGKCCNTVDWQNRSYSVYIFPLRHKVSVGYLYIDDYCSFNYKTSKHYYLMRFTFHPAKKTLICQRENEDVVWNMENPAKLMNILIIKNTSMSWAGFKTVTIANQGAEMCKINHSEDKIEITELNMNLNSDQCVTFD